MTGALKQIAGLLLFLVVFLTIRYGDWNVQLSHMSGTMSSYFMPGMDAAEVHFKSEQMSSMILPLPALFYRWGGMSYAVSLRLLSYLQFLLVGLALFHYARVLTRRSDIAWLTVLFHVAAGPFNWNFASAGEAFMFYPSQWVLAPLLYAAACALDGRTRAMIVTFAVAGWIQPALTLYSLFMIGSYVWIQAADAAERKRWFFILVALVAWTLIPALYLLFTVPNALTRSEYSAYLLTWAHGALWRFPFYFVPMLYAFGMYMVLFVFAMGRSPVSDVSRRRFMLWMLGTGVILPLVLNIAGIQFQIPMMVHTMPLRVGGLFVLLTLPWILQWLHEKLVSPAFGHRAIGWAAVVLPMVCGTPFVWCVVFLLALSEAIENKTARGTTHHGYTVCLAVVAVGLLSVWGTTLFQMSQSPSWALPQWLLWADFQALMRTVASQSVARTLIVAAGLVVAGTLLYRKQGTLAVLALAALFHAHMLGAETRIPKERELVALQMWVRDHTTPQDRFITVWPLVHTAIAPRMEVYPASQLSGYLIPQHLVTQMRRLHQFYASEMKVPRFEALAQREGFPETYSAIHAFESLNETQIRQFAQTFGGNYLIRSVSDRPLKFPVVYRNHSHIIYQL